MEITSDSVCGLDLSDFDFDQDLAGDLTASAARFREFVQGDWDHVLTAAFVFKFNLSIRLSTRFWPFLNMGGTEKQGQHNWTY
jgi:hypothetical protein